MSKPLTFLASAAMALCLALPLYAEDAPNADTVVATVNGTQITLGHMIMTRMGLPEQYQALPDDVLFKGILDQLVQQTLLSQALPQPEPKRIALAVENEHRSLAAGTVIETLMAGAVTDTALQDAYKARYADAEPNREFNAAHILVKTEDEAKAVVDELKAGADFAETAKAKSTGPSGPNGGDLGWFGPGMMVEAFEKAVMALEVGQVSDPVETQFGWHVIKLNDSRLQDIPKLEDVRGELENEIQRGAIDSRIKELTSAGSVERIEEGTIDPALLKNLDLVGN